MSNFVKTYKIIKKDLFNHGGKSFGSKLSTYFFNASFRLLLNFRVGSYLSHHPFKLFKILAKYYKYKQVTRRNCDISYNAVIGLNVKFLHPIGIIIGDNVVINDNVRIWQHVTFGSHGKLDRDLVYPTIEKGAKIFSGAVIIGGICIGENSIIGANAVVNQDIPKNSTAVGIPAKIKKNEI